MPLEHSYFVGAAELRARGIEGEPGNYPTGVLEAHPLPVSDDLHVDAYVNHGRWVARCPICGGAERVSAEHPVFWCDNCRMAQAGGQAAKVVFPNDRDQLEQALDRRPLARRNFVPGEIEKAFAKRGMPVDVTVGDWLRAEDVVHGVVPSTLVERIAAKAILYGVGAVDGELAALQRLGEETLESRYRNGGGRTPDTIGVDGQIVLGR